MDFVDLQGSSGQTYRFRKWPENGQHPPMAGNFALVRTRTRQVLRVGVVDNLSEVKRETGELQAGVALFTRLNVSRAHREAEHADLAAAYATSTTAVA